MEPKRFLPNLDVNLRNDYGHFRMRAVALIIENNHVLLATNDKDDFYYFLGGGVHVNETTEHAAIREVFEETGIKYEINRLFCVHEHFFKCHSHHHGEEDFQEVGFYYLMKSRGKMDAETQPVPEGCLKEDIHWINIEDIDSIDVRPKEIADMLRTGIPDTITHFVTNENPVAVNKTID